MPQFLSDGWFTEFQTLRSGAGDLGTPDVVKNLVINMTVTGHPEGDKNIRMEAGEFKQGHKDGAPTKITVPYEVAKALFIDGDQNAGMQAFMSGQIQVEGDMAVMMQMQAAGEPSAAAKALTEKVKAMTEV
jgi:hypothetical protein